MHRRLFALLILAVQLSPSRSMGVILYSSETRNTDPPGMLTNRGAWDGPAGAGDPRRLLGSGWQYQGRFGIYLGTPIAPNYFITAAHIGGSVGQSFIYKNLSGQDISYTTTAVSTIPNTDLRIWQVNGAFDTYAPMWDESVDGSEAGRSFVFFGRGTERGAPVIAGGTLRGWEWGTWDTVQSWGENDVTSLLDTEDFGGLIEFEFNSGQGPNEGALSAGDSGGGVFIQSNGVWKLAGINLGVSGPWRTSPEGTDFTASLFNAGGLYVEVGDPPSWQLVPDGIPGSSYASRISSNLDAIQLTISGNNAVAIPEPGTLLGAGVLVLGLRRREKNLAKRSFRC